jgi:hypothetical protein
MLIPTEVVKLFWRLSDWAALVVPALVPSKAKLEGESVMGGAIPVPLKLTVCGLLLALSMTLIEPAEIPRVVGLNITTIMQNAFALSEAGQSFA